MFDNFDNLLKMSSSDVIDDVTNSYMTGVLYHNYVFHTKYIFYDFLVFFG